ncbi:AMP-binding protein [Pseudonocardia asaccharolytica]|uniref:Acetyl-CoA synthetase n=1 Tax=Pseudonocardia asaccharolytica DSM 44247 = NBRC 16224 TaxID=1123024 RepID=A0A511DAH7_9PSEU|nr:AMP-binding protein [Pseudonocardia asaccharolytica]GEL19948.1 acetyl-CoA synthetase [Pseudonocardia asaccharolytica DSM 44247 = NBRC 16224]
MRLSPSAHQDTFCRDHLPPPDQWPQLTFDLPELHYADRLNCASALLDEPIGRFGADRPCVRGGDTAWTYAQLRRHANQVSAVLTGELGLVPGNRVLLRGANSPWLAACWLGVLKAGGVAVTTMAMLRAAEIATIGALARPTIALCDARDVADLHAAAIRGLRIVPYGGDTAGDLTARCSARGDDGGAFTDVATAADDVALLAFTSGTTGRPKATMHFHRDVLAIADTFARHVVAHRPDDVVTGTPPLAFTYGLGGLLVFPLHAGASTVLLEHPSPDELADAIAAHGVTALYTSPTMYRALLAPGRPERLAGLRRCMSAGETLPAAVWTEFHERTGIRIIDGIGSTEMLHVFISAADDDIRPGATGRPVPGYHAAVVDDEGHPVPDGRPGHLVVQGPTGCRYLDGDRQENYVRDGWNVTGDTYLRDADGYFWYQARSDDMIISAGYNISGPEVEQALVGHPDVVDCAVVGLPDERRGMLVTAFVVLRAGAPSDENEIHVLQDHVKQTIAPYKYPRAVRFVDRLPRTSTGKLQRYRLRRQGIRPPADLARG